MTFFGTLDQNKPISLTDQGKIALGEGASPGISSSGSLIIETLQASADIVINPNGNGSLHLGHIGGGNVNAYGTMAVTGLFQLMDSNGEDEVLNINSEGGNPTISVAEGNLIIEILEGGCGIVSSRFIAPASNDLYFLIGNNAYISITEGAINFDAQEGGSFQFSGNGTTFFSGSPGNETIIGAIPSISNPDVDVRLVAQGTGKIIADGPLDAGPFNSRSEALPVASASLRGMIRTVEAVPGVADAFWICLKSALDTYSWKQIIAG